MPPRHQPDLVRNTWRERTSRDVVCSCLHNPLSGAHLLIQAVAKDAALFVRVVIAGGPHAPGWRGEGGQPAITGPAPCSPGGNDAITCGALVAPGQNGQRPSGACFSGSSPTITQERVIGSLRNSI